jgi:hypothetical protein
MSKQEVFFPGLHIHHDPRNERFLMTRKVSETGPVVFKPKTAKHRQYRYYNQGQEPSCTGYGSVTLLATGDPFNVPPITGSAWYILNQEYDRNVLGLHYSEGATVTAALAVGKNQGYYSEYRWAYEILTMQEAIVKAPLIAGTYWYPSMFTRDDKGIVKMPGEGESPVGGHLYCINGYDAKRDLWRIPNSWGDGDYFFPGELMHRLLREEGEVAQVDELKLPKAKK